MRKTVVALAVVVAGCVTGPSEVSVLHRTGVVQSQRSADYDACKIASFKEIPQSIATDVQGGYSSPGSMNCSTIGMSTQCYPVGGFSVPATSVSYDVNGSLRDRFVHRCLAAKGYDFLQRPVCKGGDEMANARAQLTTGMPPSDQVKCASDMPLN